MLTVTSTMPLAGRELLSTTDVVAAREHLSRLFWPHSVRLAEAKPRMHFRHRLGELGSLSLNALRYGTAVVIDSEPADSSYLIMLTLDGHALMHQDADAIECTPGTVAVMNPNQLLKVRLSPDHNQLTVRMDGLALRDALEAELGRTLDAPLQFLPTASSLSSQTPGLSNLIAACLGDLEHESSGLQNPLVARHLAATLMALALTELPHNYSEELAARDAAVGPAYVRVVSEFIEQNFGDELSLDDLIMQANCSRRALQAGFRRYRNTTPMRYLREWRLKQAHASLIDPADARSVSEIAFDCGFSDLSKFARFYRERYGTTPSASKRRAAGSD